MQRLLVTFISLCALSGGLSAAETPVKPNIIFFLADDLGWRDTTCYGSRFYETPGVDRLAKRGMRFTNAYAANPFCSPTRASILTGQYPGRIRLTVPVCHLKEERTETTMPATAAPTVKLLTPQCLTRFPLDYVTIAERLREAGYATAHFGKWHLGWPPYGPENQGFQSNLPGGSYPGPYPSYFAPYKMEGFPNGPEGEHIDDRLTRHAVEFLEKNKSRPFKEQWSSPSADVKGDAYEGLLQKNSEDVKGAAGQYFTPRPLIAAIVDAVQPAPGMAICDPACGTGGFLLAAHDFIARTPGLDKAQKKRLKSGTLFGVELVDSVARLCCMNLVLHGIRESGSGVPPLNKSGQSRDGSATLEDEVPALVKDALGGKHGEYEMVLTNPPFGKKSSVTIVNEAGEQKKESLIINRDDFWAPRATSRSTSSSTSSRS